MRAGVMTRRKSAGSSKAILTRGLRVSPRSKLRASRRRRAKKVFIVSTPIRTEGAFLDFALFEVALGFFLETGFDFFIGIELHRFYFSQAVSVMVIMNIVIPEDPAVIGTSIEVHKRKRVTRNLSGLEEVDLHSDQQSSVSSLGIELFAYRSLRVDFIFFRPFCHCSRIPAWT